MLLRADYMITLSTKICSYWSRIVGVFWKFIRGPFFRHSVYIVCYTACSICIQFSYGTRCGSFYYKKKQRKLFSPSLLFRQTATGSTGLFTPHINHYKTVVLVLHTVCSGITGSQLTPRVHLNVIKPKTLDITTLPTVSSCGISVKVSELT